MLFMFNHARACDQTCSVCARDWWEWLKARESQMSTPMPDKLQLRNGSKDYFVKRGSTVPWNKAAETSVKPMAKFPVGTKVYTDHPEWGVFEVFHDAGGVGGDGRSWVGVQKGSWHFHVERHTLTLA